MWRLVISRLGAGLLVAWGSATAAFLALHALPGRVEDILAGDLDYPGLQLVRERPYVFIVSSFLSAEECDLLIRKASAAQLSQQLVGESAASERTSVGCVARTLKNSRIWIKPSLSPSSSTESMSSRIS